MRLIAVVILLFALPAFGGAGDIFVCRSGDPDPLKNVIDGYTEPQSGCDPVPITKVHPDWIAKRVRDKAPPTQAQKDAAFAEDFERRELLRTFMIVVSKEFGWSKALLLQKMKAERK